MITFNEAIQEAQIMVIAPDCKTEVRGYFTNARVDPATVPDGWFRYDIRHSDSSGCLSTIEPRVIVNHAGTFLSQKPVKLNKRGYYSLQSRAGYTFE